ncbi:MAG: hypothetical protein KDB82_08745 [Planctomycetes bacterium]|nr:hypothetical protein [Planctomycetota bacterium]
MKGPQLALLIWLANLLVLAGGAFVGYSYWQDIEADRDAKYAQASHPQTKEKKIAWQNTVDSATTADHTFYRDVLLTPYERPDAVTMSPSGGTLEKPATLTAKGGAADPSNFVWSIEGATPVGVSLSAKKGRTTQLRFSKATPQGSTVTVKASNGTGKDEIAQGTFTLNFNEKVDPEPTDEELKTELEKWVNSQFTLLRLWYGPPSVAKAVVISKEAKNATLLFQAGLKFPEEYDKERNSDVNVQKLAKYDLEVIKIEWDHVLMKGASRNPKYKDRHYEVKLLPQPVELPDINKLGKTGKIGESKIKLPDTPPPDPKIQAEDTRPKESVYDAKTDTWTLGTDDYKDINVDELARYAKVVHDRERKPLGIQISDDIPDDNSVIARGGRKGDIIKAINGKPVASMSDVRRIVRTEYNNGVEEFVVTYERDGVPGTKRFKVPKKKNNDK